MRALFTCGGTGGHINPALAVANMLRERHPESEICFAGSTHGMEARLVPEAGFELETCELEGFRRSFSVRAFSHNARNLKRVAASLSWARRVLDRRMPDVVIGTGGYASFPVLHEAQKRGIPTLIHEANAYPGLTTRSLVKKADRVLVNFPESLTHLPDPSRAAVVGMPIREEMLGWDRASARAELGLDERPLIVSFWGSLGAREMNKQIARMFALEQKERAWQHIHATGKFGYEWMPELIRECDVDLSANPQIQLREYISDMPRVMAAADLVMCRGGASTLSEIAALGKPAIIVPSPNVSDNHQEKNARALASSGGAVVLLEADCTAEKLYQLASELLEDSARREVMSRTLQANAILDATERIYQEILAICHG